MKSYNNINFNIVLLNIFRLWVIVNILYKMAIVSLRVLPAGEISQEEFTTWKNELLANLAEDMDHQLFMPGGS